MPTRRHLLTTAALILASTALLGAARAQAIDAIKAKGRVVIGSQGDNPPWGFVTTAGTRDGFDADIGHLFA